MTLVIILVSTLLSASLSSSPVPAAGQVAPQATPASQQAPANSAPDHANTPPAQKPSGPKPTSPAASSSHAASKHKAASGKHPLHKKKVVSADCNPAPASPDSATSTSPANNSGPANAAAAGMPSAKTADTPANCPPSKIVVRHGGSSEPTIHLAGGPAGEQAAQQQDRSNQMLEAAELNLKKVDASRLTANQRDMVKQIRQFMQQSKAATTAGDLDRARMLAWKAQLLSEELVNPER